MSLATGKYVHRHQYTKLPASQEIIERVNKLGKAQCQPSTEAGFNYEWQPEESILNAPNSLGELNQSSEAPALALTEEPHNTESTISTTETVQDNIVRDEPMQTYDIEAAPQ